MQICQFGKVADQEKGWVAVSMEVNLSLAMAFTDLPASLLSIQEIMSRYTKARFSKGFFSSSLRRCRNCLNKLMLSSGLLLAIFFINCSTSEW